MGMNYKAIQDAVLADAFAESKRSDVKNWIQFRHAWLWDVHDWVFKYGTSSTVSFDGTQTLASAPSDLRSVLALFDENGDQLKMIRSPRQFFDLYNANISGNTGSAEAFTVVNGVVLIGPVPNNSGTGYLVYDKTKPALSADADTTGLPEGYDLALVHGGKAEGFKLANIPLWQGFDEDFSAAVNVLASSYLTETSSADQLGAYRPGSGSWPYG